MIVHVQTTKIICIDKLLELICEFSKISRYMVNIDKKVISIYEQQTMRKILNTINNSITISYT